MPKKSTIDDTANIKKPKNHANKDTEHMLQNKLYQNARKGIFLSRVVRMAKCNSLNMHRS